MWSICTLCSYSNQPKHISKRKQHRNRYAINQLIKTEIENHTSIYHPNHETTFNINTSATTSVSSPPLSINNNESSIQYSSQNESPHSDVGSDIYCSNFNNDNSHNDSHNQNNQHQLHLKNDLMNAFPDVDDEEMKIFNSHLDPEINQGLHR